MSVAPRVGHVPSEAEILAEEEAGASAERWLFLRQVVIAVVLVVALIRPLLFG
jgi:hypothetical protein